MQVISGMAAGIDSAGHAGALSAGGTTFAVLGCGCDICYPKTSRSLYRSIPEQGGGDFVGAGAGGDAAAAFFSPCATGSSAPFPISW